jgi:hypothetical protein
MDRDTDMNADTDTDKDTDTVDYRQHQEAGATEYLALNKWCKIICSIIAAKFYEGQCMFDICSTIYKELKT